MSELKAMAAGLDAVEKALLRPCPYDEEDWIADYNVDRDYCAQDVLSLTIRLRQAAARTFSRPSSVRMQELLHDAEILMEKATVNHA